jgi:hypothetical protein
MKVKGHGTNHNYSPETAIVAEEGWVEDAEAVCNSDGYHHN